MLGGGTESQAVNGMRFPSRRSKPLSDQHDGALAPLALLANIRLLLLGFAERCC